MLEVFQGRRRKLGLATLMLASAVSILMMRSYFIAETIYVPTARTRSFVIESFSGRVVYTSWQLKSNEACVCQEIIFQCQEVEDRENEIRQDAPKYGRQDMHRPELDGRWRQVGPVFHAYFEEDDGDSRNYYVIHYSSVILPLLLVSAWLILSDRRPTSQQRDGSTRDFKHPVCNTEFNNPQSHSFCH